MLFHRFGSQEERREWGGSDFIELQYCRHEQGATIQQLVSVEAVTPWQEDSLYISGDDMDGFFTHYSAIFCDGVYGNGQSGVVDLCGINYYSPEQSARMIQQVQELRPLEYPILLDWLKDVTQYNGFYVLGL